MDICHFWSSLRTTVRRWQDPWNCYCQGVKWILTLCPPAATIPPFLGWPWPLSLFRQEKIFFFFFKQFTFHWGYDVLHITSAHWGIINSTMLTDCFKSFTLFLFLICFAFHATFFYIKGELGKKRNTNTWKSFFHIPAAATQDRIWMEMDGRETARWMNNISCPVVNHYFKREMRGLVRGLILLRWLVRNSE